MFVKILTQEMLTARRLIGFVFLSNLQGVFALCQFYAVAKSLVVTCCIKETVL